MILFHLLIYAVSALGVWMLGHATYRALAFEWRAARAIREARRHGFPVIPFARAVLHRADPSKPTKTNDTNEE